MAIRSPHPDVAVPDVTLSDFVLAGAAARGERPAIVDAVSGAVLTYAQLAADVDRCAAGLAARGLAPGQVVGILAPNVPEYAIAFHGVARAGGANTTVNALYTAEEAAFQLQAAGARFLVTVPQLAERAREAACIAGVQEVFAVGGAAETTPFGDLLAPPGTPAPQLEIDPATHVVALPFSSGTTGLSKGVMLTHGNLVANLCQYAPVLVHRRARPRHRRFRSSTSRPHARAQRRTAPGCGIVTLPRFDVAGFLAAIEQHAITACYVAPPIVLALAKHPLVADHDLSSLRFITSGAAPLDAELQGAAERRVGCRVQQGYGMTEASPVTHYVHQDDENVHGTIGTLLPSTETRLVTPRRQGRRRRPAGRDPGARSWVMLGTWATTCHRGDAHPRWLAAHGRHRDRRRGRRFRVVDRLKELIKYKGYQVPLRNSRASCSRTRRRHARVVPVRDEEPVRCRGVRRPAPGEALDPSEVRRSPPAVWRRTCRSAPAS
jgi:acyl-CoA synthetase (AMP-forming)/AMP-acid ligase II